MKKILAFALTLIMMLSSFTLIASADSISLGGGTPLAEDLTVEVKMTNGVTIDGIISDGEYEAYDIDLDPDTSYLHMCYGQADLLEKAEEMLGTMEFYFSWSEGKINVAVRNKPDEIIQELDVVHEDDEGYRGFPEDHFCHQVAYTIASDTIQTRKKGAVCNFYYAIAKRTTDGEYLLGHYADEQLGNSDSYLPVAGEDFAISYDYETGYSTMEWSIPLSEIANEGVAGVGDFIYLSIGAEAGTGDASREDSEDGLGKTYCVSFGDFTYLVSQKSAKNHVAFKLTDGKVESSDPCAAGHTPGDPEFVSYVTEPTCIEAGVAVYDIHCTVCGELISSEEKNVPALGHKFGDDGKADKCSVCGAPNSVITPVKFSDVPEDAYFAEPVSWAVTKGVTQGIGGGKFGPDNGCTRGQVVTFLWRAAGEPTPKSDKNPFDDVKEGDYFYTAVLWAVESGITSGVSKTSFAPDSTCTRGQIVTFLWRANGASAPKSSTNPFGDVSDGDYFFSAVLWAVENGITSGVSKVSFAPNSTCTRAQVVTFLYRAMK